MKYLTIPDSVAKQKKNQHILLLYYYAPISAYILTDLLSSVWVWIMIFMDHVSKLRC